MSESSLKRGVFLSVRWLRIWFYIIGFLLFVFGSISFNKELLLFSSMFLLSGIVIQMVDRVFGLQVSVVDEFAAHIHRSSVEQFVVENDSTNSVVQSVPEMVSRVSFVRPDDLKPLKDAYKSIAMVVFVVGFSVGLYYVFDSVVVYLFGVMLLVVYVGDILFGLRSFLYFRNRGSVPDVDTASVEWFVGEYCDELGIEEPEIVYIDDESFIAGAINPVFVSSKLYVSCSLVKKQKHIQSGLIAHELGHIKTDGEKMYTSTFVKIVTPLLVILFGFVPLSMVSVFVLFCGVFVVSLSVSVATHYEEFEADRVAASVTDVEFVILALLEFVTYNPFVKRQSVFLQKLHQFVDTHPSTLHRIQRLLEVNGQSFNSEDGEAMFDDTERWK